MTKDELLIVREALNSPVVLTPALKTTPMITTKAIALIDKALAQPERKPLTDEEIDEVYFKSDLEIERQYNQLYAFARAIEAKLKQKNGYAEENT